jgi:hypothetical protein
VPSFGGLLSCSPHATPSSSSYGKQLQAQAERTFTFACPRHASSIPTVNMTLSVPLPSLGSPSRPRKRTPYRAARASCLVVLLIAVFTLYSTLSPRTLETHHLERRGSSFDLAEDLEVRSLVHHSTGAQSMMILHHGSRRMLIQTMSSVALFTMLSTSANLFERTALTNRPVSSPTSNSTTAASPARNLSPSW